jgi:hypothetical protein
LNIKNGALKKYIIVQLQENIKNFETKQAAVEEINENGSWSLETIDRYLDQYKKK